MPVCRERRPGRSAGLGAGDRGLRGALRPDAGRAAGTVHRIFPVPTLPAAGTRLRFGGGAMTPFDRDAVRSFRFVRCEFDAGTGIARLRSEEHTSELQSLMRNSYAGFCFEKKT